MKVDFRTLRFGFGGKLDLRIIYVSDALTELRQVEVVAQKVLVKDAPDSETSTVLEMLRKVPFVTVDGEDNVQVNGSSSSRSTSMGSRTT